MAARPLPPAGSTVNITSLSDVMLSLLIFFMLVTKAGIDTGADPDLRLPLATLGITQEDLRREQREGVVLVLNIDPASAAENPRVYGRLFGTGREFSVYVSPAPQQIGLRDFVRSVRGEREDFVVAIHAEAGTQFATIQPVLQAVNAARPAQVRFAFTTR